MVQEGDIDGPKIDAEKLIDNHYYSIASKATIKTGSSIPVPVDKFKAFFQEDWENVCSSGRAYNALEACKLLQLDADELTKVWREAETENKSIKFGGGFYCAALDGPSGEKIYVFNGFFMAMRSKFAAANASIHYFVVEWDPATLSWADFRAKLLGPTKPEEAPSDSLRGMILAKWQELGLPAAPSGSDNGVHASASPFEGLAERCNWLNASLTEDSFGKTLLAAGIPEETLRLWSVDPRVPLPPDGSEGSLFDALEDLDLDDCVAKAVAIAKM